LALSLLGSAPARAKEHGWTWVAPASSSAGDFRRVWPIAPGDLFAWRWVGPAGDAGPGELVHSTDGGATWSAAPGTAFSLVSDLWAAGPKDLYVAAKGLYHSGDRGVTWQRVELAGQPEIVAVWGSGPSEVWAVGDGGELAHTTNGGQTWSLSRIAAKAARPSIHALWGTSARSLYALGAFTVWRSTDGGQTWTAAFKVDRGDAKRRGHVLSRIGGTRDGLVFVSGLEQAYEDEASETDRFEMVWSSDGKKPFQVVWKGPARGAPPMPPPWQQGPLLWVDPADHASCVSGRSVRCDEVFPSYPGDDGQEELVDVHGLSFADGAVEVDAITRRGAVARWR
jgi:hypothetical protein